MNFYDLINVLMIQFKPLVDQMCMRRSEEPLQLQIDERKKTKTKISQ